MCTVWWPPQSHTGVSGSCAGGTVPTAYRVYGGASARTGDVFAESSGDKIVHAPSFMCVLDAYQAS